MPATADTIVAVSSPPGRSPRGLLRLSGPATPTILHRLLTPSPDIPRTITPSHLQLSNHSELSILSAIIPAPRSYTGQPMAELQLPGNPALLDRVIHRIIELGAPSTRLAEPGEFTFRAFLAGKLDLTQAEGVAATISAVSDAQLRAANNLREGKLGRFASELVDRLATQLAFVEAGIDFVDQDDVVPISPVQLLTNLTALVRQLDDLLAHSRSWSVIEALPRVVLVGPPNVGKSTLFNALLGRTRAVTSPAAGTTRDILEEPLTLDTPNGPLEVMLVDIAGLDDPRSALDRSVQDAARSAIARADLLILLNDGTNAAPSLTIPPGVPTLSVRAKLDLALTPPPASSIPVSARTGTGLPALRETIARQLAHRAASVTAESLVLQPRHESALRSTGEHLQSAVALLTPQHHSRAIAKIELVASALRAALDELASLGGQMTPDDVIGKIFATFCVGK